MMFQPLSTLESSQLNTPLNWQLRFYTVEPGAEYEP
jgi:hypothetical protein